MTRKKFTSKFKLKVVLEALKEQKTLSELAQNFEITPQQISTWNHEFLDGAEQVFGSEPKDKKREAELEKENHLKIIGEL